MTAPAPILHPRAATRPASREAVPAAASAAAPQDKTSEFAAHLAQDAPHAEPQPRAAQSVPELPATSQTLTEEASAPAEEPGKTLPPIRQKAATLLAATGLLLGAKDAPAVVTERDGEPSAPADQPDAEAPGAATPMLAVLALTLPVAMPAARTAQAPAPTDSASMQGPRTAAPGMAMAAAPPAVPGSGDPAQVQGALAGAHPAALAVANLVLERDAAVLPGDAAPNGAPASPESQPTATPMAARAQPSTLATLVSAPERPGPRKQRTEGETALPGMKSAPSPALLPDTAGALALSQPAPAPASTAPTGAGPAAAGPQPLSFDQLVDSIARARDGVDQGGPVAVALRHGEFGRVSLRIESDAGGLSVAMASPDPGFAPAVAAAHAAATLPEPLRAAASAQRADASGQSLAQGQRQPGSGQQRQSGSAQRPAANPARTSTSLAERRSGIFA